jgi:hypothetical protein
VVVDDRRESKILNFKAELDEIVRLFGQNVEKYYSLKN